MENRWNLIDRDILLSMASLYRPGAKLMSYQQHLMGENRRSK